MRQYETAPAAVPTGPQLRDFAGIDAAREWGEQLAADLADYKAKRIRWKDVDPGVLIHGKPGTGKTTFAKALAATCGVALVATSYAEWQRAGEGHLGDLLAAMKRVFNFAKLSAPCILFIDELDTFPSRASGRSDSWWTSVVNALLELLDGVADREGVVVVGACNNATGLDPALVRAGRFDRQIEIPMPSTASLEQILRFHLGKRAGGAMDLSTIALLCAGMTGADIEKLVRDARRRARKHKRRVSEDDLIAALEGETPHNDPALLHRTAIHEAGHAVAGLTFSIWDRVSVSILRRAFMGGRTDFGTMRPGTMTRERLDKMIMTSLAGRAAEEVILGAPSAGAGGSEQSDLAQATRIATDIVSNFGLSERMGLLWFGQHSRDNPVLFDQRIAGEVNAILKATYEETLAFVASHRATIEAVAAALVKSRALAHDDILALVLNAPAAESIKPLTPGVAP